MPRPLAAVVQNSAAAEPSLGRQPSEHWNADQESWRPLPNAGTWLPGNRRATAYGETGPDLGSLLYLAACQMEWEMHADTSSAWEVISSARGPDGGMRAHALSLLEHSQTMRQEAAPGQASSSREYRRPTMEAGMRIPNGLEIIESCVGCKANREDFFCRFSTPVTRTADVVSHHTVMPAGAILFIEGQTPRGIFILCSGKAKLSTTSKEGKVLILKLAEAGDILGLSAAISGTSYEMTARNRFALPVEFYWPHRSDEFTAERD